MREYLQHVVSVTVISSAHIKGNRIFGKMLILWEIQGKYKKKTNARHHMKLIHQNPDQSQKLCAKCCAQDCLERDFLPRLIRVQ